MNVKHLVAIIAVLSSAGSAFAQQSEFVPADAGFVSTQSRAEVKAELSQAKASGAYVVAGGEEYAGQFAARGGDHGMGASAEAKSRAKVVEELRKVKASGNFVVGGKEYAGQHVVTSWHRGAPQPMAEGAGA